MYFKTLLSVSRIDHWPKQILMVPGFFYAYVNINYLDFSSLFSLILFSFLSTSLIASANYCINEYLDRNNDKYHPNKKNRVLVSQKIEFKYLLVYYFTLIFLGFGIGIIFFGIYYNLCLLFLLIMGLAYNVKPLRFKDLKLVDVISEGINNPIRFMLAYTALINDLNFNNNFVFSYWFAGIFLMTCKRLSEKKFFQNSENLFNYRPSLKNYSVNQLYIIIIFSCILSLIFLNLFFSETEIISNYFIFYFFLLFPIYYFYAVKKTKYAQTPEKFFFNIKPVIFLIIYSILFLFLYKI